MTELDARCLDAFPGWLEALGSDVQQAAALGVSEAIGPSAARWLLSGVNYLFKSVELIPDGIEDLGYVDDAFVLRECVARALEAQHDLLDLDGSGSLARLAQEAELVREFLGSEDAARLETYVATLPSLRVRGRTADEILADEQLRADVDSEATGFADQYQVPSFAREQKNLIKLRSFMNTKLTALAG